MKAVVLSLVVGFLVCQLPALAEDDVSPRSGEPDFIPDTVVWSTEGVEDAPTAAALQKLYVTLYNAGSLPVQIYEEDTYRPVATILHAEGLIYGDHFPIGIDSVLCDLNSDICSRDLVSVEDLTDIAGHVGGYQASRGNWSNSPPASLVLPNVEFYEVVDFKLKRKPIGLSGEDYVKRGNFVCEDRFKGHSCMELVVDLNSYTPDALQPESQGLAILPFRRLSAFIPTHQAAFQEISAVQEIQSSTRQVSEAWKNTLAERDPRVWITGELSDNLISWGHFSVQSAARNEPRYSDQISLLEAISHPFLNNCQLPLSMQQPVKIGVLDNHLDADHCDFGDNVSVPFPAQPSWPEDLQLARQCGQELQGPSMEYHHGTHVVGLIAAGLNRQGLAGLNPHAGVVFHSVNEDHFRDPVQRETLLPSIIVAMANVSVINVSWQYDILGGGVDTFSGALKDGALVGRLLVASAGNNAGVYRRDDPCGIRPACFHYNNVISVVGLNADKEAPALWVARNGRGSNRGDRFDIAAVAENVLSTAPRDYSVRASGTSHAAPQVTAAASLIYSVYEYDYADSVGELRPGRVKNRLMYTADLYKRLLKDVFSGRLNVERALAVADDRFVIVKDDGKRTRLSGRVIAFGVAEGEDPNTCTPDDYSRCKIQKIQCRRSNNEIEDVNVDAIRRMYRPDDNWYYIIFYNENPDDRASPLLRVTDCQLMSRSQQVFVDTEDGEQSFRLTHIRDFVSAMF